MITAVTQTLVAILAESSSLIGTEQIDFNHPGIEQYQASRLNLYCYDLRENKLMRHNQSQTADTCDDNGSLIWFDVSFLITAWDSTALGEQQLLSEALTLLLRYRFLPEPLLASALRGQKRLPIKVSADDLIDTVAFWTALGVPLRPALHVTVTAPIELPAKPQPSKKKTSLSSRL